MAWFSVIAAAIAPGIALMAYIYLKDRYDAEPISMVLRLFIFGALIVFPTMVLQRALVLGLGENPFVFSFVYSAGIEEFLKWFVLYFVIYKHVLFDEPYDGIVYATSISLGFATLENVIYVLLLGSPSVSALVMRALLPVSGHALFGIMMGYHLGKAKFKPRLEKRHLMISLSLPLFFHGMFDYILLNVKTYWLWFMLPLMIFLWVGSIWRINRANESSPFRPLLLDEEVKL